MHAALGELMLPDIASLISLCEDEGTTATLWLLAAAAIGVVNAVWPLSIKFLQKVSSANEVQKIWKVSSTWVLIVGGLLPTALILFLTHRLGRDFNDCVSGQGFFAGLFAAWAGYLAAVVFCHLLTWPRELYGRRV
jgi:hypothetical protein